MWSSRTARRGRSSIRCDLAHMARRCAGTLLVNELDAEAFSLDGQPRLIESAHRPDVGIEWRPQENRRQECQRERVPEVALHVEPVRQRIGDHNPTGPEVLESE